MAIHLTHFYIFTFYIAELQGIFGISMQIAGGQKGLSWILLFAAFFIYIYICKIYFLLPQNGLRSDPYLS